MHDNKVSPRRTLRMMPSGGDSPPLRNSIRGLRRLILALAGICLANAYALALVVLYMARH